jgi:hypothetical protein
MERPMRNYRQLEKRFLADCRAYLEERADARLEEIAEYESRYVFRTRTFASAYLEMLKAKYEKCDGDDEDDFERFMREEVEQRELSDQNETLPF